MWKIGNVTLNNRIVLAPLSGVSNLAFRQIAKEMGCALVYSEMISTMGIIYNGKKTIDLMEIRDEERPISVQIFGSDLNSFVESAKFIEKNIKPDIIDINMGCPVNKVAIKSQAGSSLLKNPQKIYEIVKNVVESVSTPVTVKIRSGWDDKHINAVEVAKVIEKAGASAIAVHPRTRAQGYEGKSDWNIIREVKNNVSIPVIGSGDVTTIYDAKRMIDETKCDAVMIGRGAMGNPWLIKECIEYLDNNLVIDKPTINEKIECIKKHYELLEKYYGDKRAILEIRNNALWYLKSIPNSKQAKLQIVRVTNKDELYKILDNLLIDNESI